MDLISLESFAALCKYGNFTKAAEYMFISQSALSKRIAALEVELGLQLIERNSNGVVLTLAGRELLEKSKDILQLRFETEKRMADIRKGITECIHIGYKHDTPPKLIVPAIELMSKQHPEIELRISVVSPTQNFCDLIHRKMYDVIIGLREEFENSNEVAYRVFKHSHYCILAGREHPCYEWKQFRGKDLLPYKLVLYTRDNLYEKHSIAKYYDSCGYDRRSLQYTDDKNGMLYYVCTGEYLGVSCLDLGQPEELVKEYIRSIPLVDCNLSGGDPAVGYQRDNRAAGLFVDTLVEVNK